MILPFCVMRKDLVIARRGSRDAAIEAAITENANPKIGHVPRHVIDRRTGRVVWPESQESSP